MHDIILKSGTKNIEIHINDKKEGISSYYYKDGSLKSEISYVGGKKQGLTKEYNEEGLIQSLVYYHNGILQTGRISIEQIMRE